MVPEFGLTADFWNAREPPITWISLLLASQARLLRSGFKEELSSAPQRMSSTIVHLSEIGRTSPRTIGGSMNGRGVGPGLPTSIREGAEKMGSD